MDNTPLSIPITQGWGLIALYVLASLALTLLILRPRRLKNNLTIAGVVFIAGSLMGLFLSWFIGDFLDVFGISLTPVTRMWVCLGCVGILLACTNLWKTGWGRRFFALMSIPVFVVAAAAGINVEFGEYPTIGDLVAPEGPQEFNLAALTAEGKKTDFPIYKSWVAPDTMPAAGKVTTTTIPATLSGFPARPTLVYLPPAALVPTPPALPVIVMLAGQPGGPEDLLTSGKLPAILDGYASAHKGLAPIVIMPDQLGDPLNNPMCVDSPLGNSQTYLTRDVVNWTRSHLPVDNSPEKWTIGGFSQGGTCAAQLGAGFPRIFGNLIDIAGELEQSMGDQTVREGFGGSQEKYDAAKPLNLLAANTPYAHSYGVFGAGSNDSRFLEHTHKVHDAAQKAGFQTEYVESPGSAHDWHTVNYVFEKAISFLGVRLGLSAK
ncbi:alpha/beta hydrolase-fold protein [Lysinibacter sp. HNR]|uniref:alpha/beta hydrolase n=1 Tax=Lysinibacter sp. HNR TaxID=3031408 RepID=UPI002434D056|nr:alpha/beta hydrolase-fold protein [Lysinibacter sp. HNR]WGD37135.1 alpha/beta hydrolase-fold protein [Lysinibacter sp. HNR]